MTSVNTNNNAYIALQTLNQTSSALATAQKQISTGYRVADATDDGGAFAVAQQVRSDVGALTTVNQQLGHAQGLVGTANTALTDISNTIGNIKGVLTEIADGTNTDAQRSQYIATFNSYVQKVASDVDNSTYGGQTLLGSTNSASGTPVAGTSKSVIINENGATSTISGEDSSGLANSLAGLIGETFTRTAGADSFGTVTPAAAQSSAAAALISTAAASTLAAPSFTALQTQNANQLNQVGVDSNAVSSQITFNSNKIDSLNSGLGALVDADLSKESAVLQSLQVKQQLGTQALSIANQSPQALLSLFK